MTSASREIGGEWSKWNLQCSSLWTLDYSPSDACKLVAVFGTHKQLDPYVSTKTLMVGGFVFSLVTDHVINQQSVSVTLKDEWDNYYPKFGD